MTNVIGKPEGSIDGQAEGVVKTPFEELLEKRGLSAKGVRTLVVEDVEPLARMGGRMLSRALKVQGQIAHSGESGLEAMADLRGRMACVVTDVNMGNMSGPEMLRKANGRGLLDKVPVVIMTGDLRHNIPVIADLIVGGISHIVLEKPFNADDLVAAVQAACRNILAKMDAKKPE